MWRTAPLPRDWKRIRARVLRRDRGMCTWPGCGEKATEVDHVNGPDDHRIDSLRSLCAPHHRQVTAQQANAARWSKWQPRKRPQEKHPGLA